MPIINLVDCAVNLAEKVTGADIDRDGDVGQRTSNESGAVTSSTVRSFVAEPRSVETATFTSAVAVEDVALPVFDAATPKVSILAIGKGTLESANELLVEAGKQAAEFQPQATLKADFMLKNYAAGPGSTTTTDLTTGIADWTISGPGFIDGTPAPPTDPNPVWYTPTGKGKWLGNATTGAPGDYFFKLSFEVTAPEVASLNLAFAVDDQVPSATLNDKALMVVGGLDGGGQLAGKIDAGSRFFTRGTNTLVVKVFNANAPVANPYGFYAEGTITGTNATTCTFANATGARLEFFEDGSNGLLSDDYMPPPILEPGAVASFLVDKASFALPYNIQVFQGPGAPAPVGGWVRGEDSKAVTLSLSNRSAEIEADVQVFGPNPGPPAMYPTKFYFDVYNNGDLVQIFAKQLIDSYPR